jgi:pyruvate kinase
MKSIKKVKIIATIGPATQESEMLKEIITSGVDVIRINAAHTPADKIIELTDRVKSCAKELKIHVGVLVDLPGPKMRTSKVEDAGKELTEGMLIELLPQDIESSGNRIGTTVSQLCEIVKKDDEIILGDGRILTKVVKTSASSVTCEVIHGGVLLSKKGFFIPSAEYKIEAFTEKDELALEAAIACKANFVGLSFVRNAQDIEKVKDLIPADSQLKTIAKIETKSAVDELHKIIAASYGVMVARGDLGIQLKTSRVPILQKEIIAACNSAGKPVITATEMLESMTYNSLPTRAEVGDVANAVMDGTDAVMLSGETAVGLYPVETVQTMVEVIIEAEKWHRPPAKEKVCFIHDDKVGWAVAHAAVQAGEDLNVNAILCPTSTGTTAQRVAAYRPRVPIIGITHDDEVLGSLSLIWGVTPVRLSQSRQNWAEERGERRQAIESGSETDFVVHETKKAGYIDTEDLVAVAKGSVNKSAGGTDSLRIVKV